jgi:hypothetical protein
VARLVVVLARQLTLDNAARDNEVIPRTVGRDGDLGREITVLVRIDAGEKLARLGLPADLDLARVVVLRTRGLHGRS